ncbi:MAG: hypothetical protein Kow0042_10910 [Calditrichia bacterium]
MELIETNNGAILAASAEGTFRSADGGNTWDGISGFARNQRITGFFKTAGGVIYAGGMDRTAEVVRLYRSSDHGLNWVEFSQIPTVVFTAPDPRVPRVVVNSQNHIFISGSQGGASNMSHLVRSTDDGANWTSVMTSGKIGGTLLISDVAINSSDHLFVAVPDGADGLYRSLDNGETWTKMFDSEVSRVVVDANDHIYIISGNSADQIQRSTDNGENWTDISPTGLPKPISLLTGLLVDDAGQIFAGMALSWTDGAVGGEGIVRSLDGGISWDVLQNGLPAARHIILNRAGVQAILRHSSGKLFCGLNASAAELTTAQGMGGIYASTDNGDNWGEVNTGVQAVPFHLIEAHSSGGVFAAPFYGLLYSNDGGNSWTERSPLIISGFPFHIASLTIDPQSGDVLAGGHNILYRSTDLGLTWGEIGNGQIPGEIYGIALNSSGHLFVARSGGISRSTDGGGSWQFLLGGGGRDIEVAANDIVYAATASNGLLRSTNNGDDWTQMSNGLPSLVNQVTSAPDNAVYAGERGIWRSTDNGDTWIRIDRNGIPQGSLGVLSPELYALETNSQGHVFASVYYSDTLDVAHFGVFRSTDAGESWMLHSTGIRGTYTYGSDLSFDSDGFAYLAATNGVYRSNQSTTALSEYPSPQPVEFGLAQNYPNPFNPITHVEFRLSVSARVKVQVFDIQGKAVKVLVDERRSAGTHSLQWDGTNEVGQAVASGVYVYRLRISPVQSSHKGGVVLSRKMILIR